MKLQFSSKDDNNNIDIIANNKSQAFSNNITTFINEKLNKGPFTMNSRTFEHFKQRRYQKTHTNIFAQVAQRITPLLILIILVNSVHESYATTAETRITTIKSTTPRYSQLLSTNGKFIEMSGGSGDDDDMFRPFVLKDPEIISRSVFTPSGQFRVFQPIESDLRATVTLEQATNKHQMALSKEFSPQAKENAKATKSIKHNEHPIIEITKPIVNGTTHKPVRDVRKQNIDKKLNTIEPNNNDLSSDLKSLEDLLVEYVQNFFEKGQYQPLPGLVVELQKNHSDPVENSHMEKTRNVRQTSKPIGAKVSLDVPRTLATGRLLFLTGLKKVLWPVFMGLQVLKSLLIAMFIPALIGSFTKLLGKGISSGSAPLFIRPMDPPQELDFRDNFGDGGDKFLAADDVLNDPFQPTDDTLKDHKAYAYNQPEASQYSNQYAYNSVDSSSHLGPLSFTRLGMNERQHQLMQNSYMGALQTITSASFKNSNSISGGSSQLSAPMVNKPAAPANMNTFQQFQKVPASSLLLSNYDPFYSPLLSRLDSVFAQLKLKSDNEECREKVICLMYANPAKYAPYSNLVSAQLSRELNELRKPTSDNPDILRFFKYMRAAKDGQDGVDCEQAFEKCTEFKDFENPAMVSTYHDINKLVQARKMA
ncbi:protein Osi24 [Musca autumnalis]|uniref:protein Osi24 n=1 Tax=Musca autumnalis TaxID=221902 RepID=UPI003CFB324F